MMTVPNARTCLAVSLALAATTTACSDAADPVPAVESLALSADSIAIQLRDSTSELTATPKGALGVDLDADVTWEAKNTNVVTLVPNGKTVRLVPVRPGTADVAASSENIVVTAKVVVLDTVFSVQFTSGDTLVTLGRSVPFSAAVHGPPNVSTAVEWKVADATVAKIDSIQAPNRVFVSSQDTGRTVILATSAIDRNKFAQIPFRIAHPVSLFFESQPGQATEPIRVNDYLIPGPIVRALDAVGNVFPGPLAVTMAITPNTGSSGASLFGSPTVTTTNGEGRFENLGVDLEGTGYQLTATSPGLAPATSATFTVGPECPGIAYTIGSTISGTLTTSACQSRANEYYDRYVVTSPVQQYFTIRITSTPELRKGLIFPDGARVGPVTDTIPVVVAPGTFSIRAYSTASGATAEYQLRTGPPNIPRGVYSVSGPFVCQIVQVHRGITLPDDLRCAVATPFPCGAGVGTVSLYRLHLPANKSAIVTATSAAFDPCLVVWSPLGQPPIVQDPDVPGRSTARVVVPPSPVARNVVVAVKAPATVALATPFTISIQP